MNKVVLIGRLTNDPELKFLPSNGTANCTLTLAVDKYNIKYGQIEAIEKALKESDITIEPNIKPISYEERVQSSGDGSSYAEKEAMRLTEFKIKRVAEKRLEKEKLLEQIDQIELDYIYIKYAIEPIKGIFKELLKMNYE
ncbi:single-stranded DNA-binding protein [Clostridium saccharoperbutylacetonicum]|jgi:hypothetical protein